MTIRWDCKKNGCYKDICIPNWDIFKGCFDKKNSKISVGDVDGIVEINGFILLFEWKRSGGELSKGQSLLLEAFTANSPKQSAILIVGELGKPEKYKFVWRGAIQKRWTICNSAEIRKKIEAWVDYAIRCGRPI